jgi:hypothetical protein
VEIAKDDPGDRDIDLNDDNTNTYTVADITVGTVDYGDMAGVLESVRTPYWPLYEDTTSCISVTIGSEIWGGGAGHGLPPLLCSIEDLSSTIGRSGTLAPFDVPWFNNSPIPELVISSSFNCCRLLFSFGLTTFVIIENAYTFFKLVLVLVLKIKNTY